MAFKLLDLFVNITAKDSGIHGVMQGIHHRAEALHESLEGISHKATHLLLAHSASLAGVLHAFAHHEAAENKLINIMKVRGEATEQNVHHMHALSEATVKQTTLGRAQVEAAMSLGMAMGISTAGIDRALKAAIGYSEALDIDLNSAMSLVAKAGEGMTMTLKRHGIFIDETASKEKQYQQVIEGGIKWYPLATEKVHTFSGAFIKLGHELDAAAAQIGGVVAGGVNRLMIKVIDVVKGLATWIGANRELAKTIGEVGTAILVVLALGPRIALFLAMLTADPVILLVKAFVALAAALIAVKFAEDALRTDDEKIELIQEQLRRSQGAHWYVPNGWTLGSDSLTGTQQRNLEKQLFALQKKKFDAEQKSKSDAEVATAHKRFDEIEASKTKSIEATPEEKETYTKSLAALRKYTATARDIRIDDVNEAERAAIKAATKALTTEKELQEASLRIAKDAAAARAKIEADFQAERFQGAMEIQTKLLALAGNELASELNQIETERRANVKKYTDSKDPHMVAETDRLANAKRQEAFDKSSRQNKSDLLRMEGEIFQLSGRDLDAKLKAIEVERIENEKKYKGRPDLLQASKEVTNAKAVAAVNDDAAARTAKYAELASRLAAAQGNSLASTLARLDAEEAELEQRFNHEAPLIAEARKVLRAEKAEAIRSDAASKRGNLFSLFADTAGLGGSPEIDRAAKLMDIQRRREEFMEAHKGDKDPTARNIGSKYFDLQTSLANNPAKPSWTRFGGAADMVSSLQDAISQGPNLSAEQLKMQTKIFELLFTAIGKNGAPVAVMG